jgi:hypothetical protein
MKGGIKLHYVHNENLIIKMRFVFTPVQNRDWPDVYHGHSISKASSIRAWQNLSKQFKT